MQLTAEILTPRTIRRLRRLAKQQGRPCDTLEDAVRLFAYVSSATLGMSEETFLNELVNSSIDSFYDAQRQASVTAAGDQAA